MQTPVNATQCSHYTRGNMENKSTILYVYAIKYKNSTTTPFGTVYISTFKYKNMRLYFYISTGLQKIHVQAT